MKATDGPVTHNRNISNVKTRDSGSKLNLSNNFMSISFQPKRTTVDRV